MSGVVFAFSVLGGMAAAFAAAPPVPGPAVELQAPAGAAGTRCVWDFDYTADLSKCRGISFAFRCDDLEQFSGFFVYFQCGTGWYCTQFSPDFSKQWDRLYVLKTSAWPEGKPSGWDNVSRLRIAGVRSGKAVGTVCSLSDVCAIASDAAHEDPAPYRAEIRRMPSKSPEFRGFWCHQPWGLDAQHDWDKSAKFMKDHGFNALIVNPCWGPSAAYPSAILRPTAEVAEKGDALDACLKACRQNGLECHAWKVCWNMGSRTTQQTHDEMVADGRTQMRFDGRPNDRWLCPSDTRNLRMEIESMVELASRGVDGIHFDYIRYLDKDSCFCNHCRRRFEKVLGHEVANWPGDVRSVSEYERKWADFRVANISRLVRKVSERVRSEYPKVKISAAVWHQPGGVDYRQIGQDWPTWCEKGWLDFVCPMDYVASAQVLSGRIDFQKPFAGKVKMRPGLGLSCWYRQDALGVRLARQIMTVRSKGLDGFVVFNLDEAALLALPEVLLGPTSSRAKLPR